MSNKLDDVLKKLNKEFGANTVVMLGNQERVPINCISTGSLQIDKALGGSGVAKGRITEIWGVESAGKTTLALQVVAQTQAEGKKVLYVDTEQALSLEYAATLGVNTDAMYFSQPQTAEQALEIICQAATADDIGLIVLDSVGSLCPQVELEGEMEAMNIGIVARLMSKFCRKIVAILSQSNCALICINQLRQKINTGFQMGNPETTTGGNALKYFASQRIELRKTTAIKEGEEVVGTKVKVKIVKNKIANPMQVCEVPLIFGKGFGGLNEVVDMAIDYGMIEKSGAWFNTHDGQRFQGKSRVIEYYNNNEEASKELLAKVKAKLANIECKPEYEIDPNTGEVLE